MGGGLINALTDEEVLEAARVELGEDTKQLEVVYCSVADPDPDPVGSGLFGSPGPRKYIEGGSSTCMGITPADSSPPGPSTSIRSAPAPWNRSQPQGRRNFASLSAAALASEGDVPLQLQLHL